MSIRNKLLLYFFSLSMLIFIVGMMFYVQLNNLIEPLTPQSIPQSVEQLGDAIDKNEFIHKLLYQAVLVQNNLQTYVFTADLAALHLYYLNEALFLQVMGSARLFAPELGLALKQPYAQLVKIQNTILNYMQQQDRPRALHLILSPVYLDALQQMNNILTRYHDQAETVHNETAVVSAKIATKNTKEILHNSLRTTLLIFFNAILISLAFAFFSTRAISRPLKILQNDMERMSIKNLNIPVSPALAKFKGELGDLAQSFINLIEKLRTTTVLRDELLIEIERRKRFEIELRQMALELAESNRDLNEFAYAASHDLKAPLRGIQNLVDWIIEDSAASIPASSRTHLELLKKRALRLDELINGILIYSRMGKSTIETESIDLNILLPEIIDNLAPPPNINLQIDPLPTLSANRASLTQVFLNLISNAIKFNDRDKGNIRIGYQELPEYYQFFVADNGAGIDPQFHDIIFNIFQTLQSRDKIEGAGIGLAIVKRIVEKVGGKIWVSSVVGGGSTFYFTWPKG